MIYLQDYDLLFESRGKKFTRKPLPYSLKDLSPSIDKETMEEHYGVHYKKYTDNLNQAIVEEKIDVEMGPEMEGIKKILRNVDKYSDKVRNNGGGFYNHYLYFQNMSPEKKTPKGDLAQAIKESFGGLSQLKKNLEESGTGLFGSGWVWIVSDKRGNLSILTTPNQDNPIMKKSFIGEILLGMDVWEHAYYLKHKADRKSYIKDFLEVVDWDVVNERFKKVLSSNRKS
jgi:Fe-Mn family superoxide dismutase